MDRVEAWAGMAWAEAWSRTVWDGNGNGWDGDGVGLGDESLRDERNESLTDERDESGLGR